MGGNPKVGVPEKRKESWREKTRNPPKIIFVSFTVLPQPLSPPIATVPYPYQPDAHRINLSPTKPVLSRSRLGTDRHVICTQLFIGTNRKASCYHCHLPLSNNPRQQLQLPQQETSTRLWISLALLEHSCAWIRVHHPNCLGLQQ